MLSNTNNIESGGVIPPYSLKPLVKLSLLNNFHKFVKIMLIITCLLI